MSLLNGFNGQGNRPPARPAADQAHPATGQPNWGQPNPQQAAQPQQPAQQWAQPSPAGYAPQNYGHAPAPATQGHSSHTYPAQHAPSYGSLSANPDPYAPSFEPYATPAHPAAPQRASQQPAYQPQAAPHAYQQHSPATQSPLSQGYGQQGYGLSEPRTQSPQHAPQQAAPQQWAPQPPAARGFDAGNYLQQPVTAPPAAHYRTADPRQHEVEPSLSDWQQHGQGAQQHANQGYDYADPNGYGEPGFAQPAGGELEQQYAEDDGQEYEVEEPSRIRRPMMIAAALAGAILVGGGLAYGYKSFLGGAPGGTPPTVKSATAPAKTKPADAGGTQFAHTDSKIMGRLGEGAPAAGAPAGDAAEVDANGVRKVKPLVIGRDGSIQAPAAAPAAAAPAAQAAATPPAAAQPAATVSVPGMMVVDALGPKANAIAASAPAPVQVAAAAPAAQKLVVTPPAAAPTPAAPAKPAATTPAARPLPDATGSIEPAAAPVVKKPVAAKKVAAATVNDAFSTASGAPAAAAAPVTGGNGYVAVLASVPKSASSQGDALKRFADMQQKYSSVLTGKTPSVAEANLGAKGAYHRLVVGPPASREQANTVCSQLKAQGYTDCWVTSY